MFTQNPSPCPPFWRQLVDPWIPAPEIAERALRRLPKLTGNSRTYITKITEVISLHGHVIVTRLHYGGLIHQNAGMVISNAKIYCVWSQICQILVNMQSEHSKDKSTKKKKSKTWIEAAKLVSKISWPKFSVLAIFWIDWRCVGQVRLFISGDDSSVYYHKSAYLSTDLHYIIVRQNWEAVVLLAIVFVGDFVQYWGPRCSSCADVARRVGQFWTNLLSCLDSCFGVIISRIIRSWDLRHNFD